MKPVCPLAEVIRRSSCPRAHHWSLTLLPLEAGPSLGFFLCPGREHQRFAAAAFTLYVRCPLVGPARPSWLPCFSDGCVVSVPLVVWDRAPHLC